MEPKGNSIKLSTFLKYGLTKTEKAPSKKKKKNFMAPFYGWGSPASRLERLRGGSLLFTTKSPEITGTHFMNLKRMKG